MDAAEKRFLYFRKDDPKEVNAIQGTNPIPRRLKEAEQKISILYEIMRFVSSLLDVELVLDAIVHLLRKEFKLDACSIRLLDADGKLRIKSQLGLSKTCAEGAAKEPAIDRYSEDCFLTGKIVIVNDTDQIAKPALTGHIVCENTKSFAVTPIKVEGETIGILVTASKKRNYFHERFNDAIYVISNQIGIAIRISQLYEEIQRLNQGLEKQVRQRTLELEQRTQELIAAERLATLGEMSRKIAHDLRNSLTVIGGLARRLHEKPSGHNPQKEYIEIIMDEVKVLEDKVSNLIKLGDGA